MVLFIPTKTVGTHAATCDRVVLVLITTIITSTSGTTGEIPVVIYTPTPTSKGFFLCCSNADIS